MGGGTRETVTNMMHLSCTLIEARSLANKRQELENLMYEDSGEDVADSELVIEGYNIIR